MTELDDDALLDALGVEVKSPGSRSHTRQEERILAGFDEITRWCERNGREPSAKPEGDIFERLFAVRLSRLRSLPDALTLLTPRDTVGLLKAKGQQETELGDEALLAELGVSAANGPGDILTLRHVESFAQRKAAEEIAARKPCSDFEAYRPTFHRVHLELRSGARSLVRLKTRRLEAIRQGSFFVVDGQLCYIAEVSASFTTDYERQDSRLRIIYDNQTEANLLQRSFQRALHRDQLARVVTETSPGPLFDPSTDQPISGEALAGPEGVSGTIYVLRSDSNHPFVRKHRELVHKIGMTTGEVSDRIAGAAKESTYLFSEVEVVAQYALANIVPLAIEKLFHRLFSGTRIDLTVSDQSGRDFRPREWFLVPLHVIDEVVSRIQDGSITEFEYCTNEAKLTRKTPRV